MKDNWPVIIPVLNEAILQAIAQKHAPVRAHRGALFLRDIPFYVS
jgi:hypothetical protein